jgi:hypothetical protein
MFALLNNTAKSLCARLPQNVTQQALQTQAQIDALKLALTDKTSSTFQNKMEESKSKLAAEKESCQNALNVLNGAFYKDPSSWLNRRWKAATEAVNAALGFSMKRRTDLAKATSLLDAAVPSEAVSKAKAEIQSFLILEKQRDAHQTRLLEIISIEKGASSSAPSLESQLKTLQTRQKELCGNRYQDPNSLLHKSWKVYKEALAKGRSNAESLLQGHKVLEREQKTNVAQIIALQKQIKIAATPIEKGIQKVTEEEIRVQIKDLTTKKATEDSRAGVDWAKTVQIASTLIPTPFLRKEPLKIK